MDKSKAISAMVLIVFFLVIITDSWERTQQIWINSDRRRVVEIISGSVLILKRSIIGKKGDLFEAMTSFFNPLVDNTQTDDRQLS